ncbi:MAG: GNAT family N-acetyltransferase [Bacteroidales bacterium]|nr:GNAT family N-acetyltransferase [Bacteroidales bacterium]
MKFLIREYSGNDFSQVKKLWQLTGLDSKSREDDNKIIKYSIANGGKLFILEEKESNEIIGSSWITFDQRRLYLHHFAIHPDFQGRGLSKLLLKSSLEFAKEQGKQIKLEVHKNNQIAKELYVNAGFKYLGDYEVYIIRKYN